MKKKQHILWLILISLFAAVIVAVFLFWDSLLLYIAPKTVLTGAITKVYDQLETRFLESPLAVMSDFYNSDGCYTAQFQTEASNPLIGPIRYNMVVQTDGAERRLYGEGAAGTQEHNIALCLYLDSNFMAASSPDIVNDTWYGITYESFEKDIRSIPLLKYVISDTQISRWNESVSDIQSQMQKDWFGPKLPSVSSESMRILTAGLLMLPGKVSSDQVLLDNVWTECHRVDYFINAESFPGIFSQEDAHAAISFYLYDKTLVLLDFYYAAGNDRTNGTLSFGLTPGTGIISAELKQTAGESFTVTRISAQPDYAEGEYTETLSVEQDGLRNDILYTWNADSGVLSLSVNQMPSAELTITTTDRTLSIQTDDLGALISNFTQNECGMDFHAASAAIQSGSEIETPPYKNLDTWSLEDFWKLLGGIGVLFGVKAE